jgi:hypothetical protein
MKIAITIALLAPLAIEVSAPAYAKLTPLQQLPTELTDVTSLHTGPAAASLERNYFQAPPQKPVEARRITPCTVQMVVFDKVRLAQACF